MQEYSSKPHLVRIRKNMSTTFRENMLAIRRQTSDRNDFVLSTLDGSYDQEFGFLYNTSLSKLISHDVSIKSLVMMTESIESIILEYSTELARLRSVISKFDNRGSINDINKAQRLQTSISLIEKMIAKLEVTLTASLVDEVKLVLVDNQAKLLPKYVSIQSVSLRCDAQLDAYYRDAGAWQVGYLVKDDSVYTNEPGWPEIHDIKMTECTYAEYAKDNAEYDLTEEDAESNDNNDLPF